MAISNSCLVKAVTAAIGPLVAGNKTTFMASLYIARIIALFTKYSLLL